MAHSLELLVDDALDGIIRAQWQTLADAGLPSRARVAAPTNRPHVTLVAAPSIPAAVDAALVPLARGASALLVLMPAFSTVVVWRHARLVMLRTTRPVTAGTLVELTVLAATLFAGVALGAIPAAVVATSAVLLGRASGALFLLAARAGPRADR